MLIAIANSLMRTVHLAVANDYMDQVRYGHEAYNYYSQLSHVP